MSVTKNVSKHWSEEQTEETIEAANPLETINPATGSQEMPVLGKWTRTERKPRDTLKNTYI